MTNTRTRIVDWDGIPHNADTGEALHGVSAEPQTHWIDELPATSLDGIKLETSPNGSVMRPDGVWMKRWEYEVWLFEEASDEFAGGRPGAASAELDRRVAQKAVA